MAAREKPIALGKEGANHPDRRARGGKKKKAGSA